MRLDTVLDSFHVLGSLLGVPCTSSPYVMPKVAHEISMPRGAATAFVDVNVVPMDTERVLPNQTVVVQGGRITAVGPSGKMKVPAGAVRIDARSKYLIPGLVDMHAHYNVRRYEVAVRRLFTALASGVTTIREMTPIPGDFLPLIRRLNSVPGPHIIIAPMLEEFYGSTGPRPDSIAAYLAAAKAQGYEYIDIGYTKESSRGAGFDSLLIAARRLGLAVGVHDHVDKLDAVLTLGVGVSTEHLYPQVRETVRKPEGAAALQRAGVWVTPTLNCHGDRDAVGAAVKALQDAGVGLLLGADADFEWRKSPSLVHQELAEMVGAGLTPYQALLTGTRHPAQYFGTLDESGTVVVGKRADLVLLSGNPLADIRYTREPAGVMRGGQWFDRAALDEGLIFPPPAPPLDESVIFPPQALKLVEKGLIDRPAPRPRPRPWIVLEVEGGGRAFMLDQRKKFFEKFEALTDSLAIVKPLDRPSYERVLRLLADELGAIRALLTPEQHKMFDPLARVWLRAHARRGYSLAIPGITPVP